MTTTLISESIRGAFQAWNADRDSLETQLNESLSALTAYQSHLDDWQQQLAHQREELQASRNEFEHERDALHADYEKIELAREEMRDAREQFERDRSASNQNSSEELAAKNEELFEAREKISELTTSLANRTEELQAVRDQFDRERESLNAANEKIELTRDELRLAREQFERDRSALDKNNGAELAATQKELSEARDKITALTTLLLNRTEELRTLDNRRAEVQTELELSRAREKELKIALDEHKRSVEQERSQYAEELRQLREVVERQLESPAEEHAAAAEKATEVTQPGPTPAPRPQAPSTGARVIPRENAVLGSIVEQFGKLRQQRASDRQAHRPR